mmetsp:Transcript_429/g.1523  ORF Transcript_429/g.1523 Transcript_429/m.1523 type:complete len:282 (-) Transcript_429:107-952(-)
MWRVAAQGLTIHPVAAGGFNVDAELYERTRPSYADDAVSLLLGPAPHRLQVLDLAAGTGKLSRKLLDHGVNDLVCVEPVEKMLLELKKKMPNYIDCVAGLADDLRAFDDESFDLVTVGQAFHWFANDSTLAEVRRVLRPGGRLGLIWNSEDAEEPWVAQLRKAYEVYDTGQRGDVPQYRKGLWKNAFTTPQALRKFHSGESKFFTQMLSTTAEEIVGRVKSKSYIATLAASQLADLEEELHGILDAAVQRDELSFDTTRPSDKEQCGEMPMKTEVFIATAI